MQYRDAKPEDIRFLVDSWMKGNRKGERHTFIDNEDYWTSYKRAIVKKLSVSNVTIAYDSVDPDFIVAYAVHQLSADNSLILHYIYVRGDLTKRGIATALLQHIYPGADTDKIYCTTLFVNFRQIKEKHPNIHYDPYRSI